MRKSSAAAFTLLEMMTVIVIVVILTGLVLNIAGHVIQKGNRERARGEIKMLELACENYKADNGTFPRDIPATGTSVTDVLSPKSHFDPNASNYKEASLFLYKELTGDKTGSSSSKPDGVPDEGEKRYLKEFDPRILGATRDKTTKKIIEVNGFQDPFGFPYGYSTAAAKAEEDFQRSLRTNPSATRPTGAAVPGFNSGSADLWSTAGGTTPGDVPKWEKNW